MHKLTSRFQIGMSVVDLLRAFAIGITIVMAITFFSGCITEEIGPDGQPIRKRSSDNQFHGETGVSYGRTG